MRVVKLIALGILATAGLVVCYHYFIAWEHPDAPVIDAKYQQFRKSRLAKDYATAYAIMSPAYRAGNTVDQFQYGPMSTVEDPWEEWSPARNIRERDGSLWLYPKNAGGFLILWSGPEYEWVKVDGDWFLSGKYNWYLD